MRQNLSREETRKAWNVLWDEWVQLDLQILKSRFLPEKLRIALAFRKVAPLALMIAPTFLMGLTAKGMSVDELAGLVDSFLDHGWFHEYEGYELPDPNTVYSNGFGGDGIKTINVSTGAMIIAAAAGIPCYKMGSRTYFSHSGSHNFLEIVGVKASVTPEHALHTLHSVGIAYIDGVATADVPTQAIGIGLSIMPGARQLMKTMTYPFRFPILCLNPLKPRISVRGVGTIDTEVPAEFLRSYYPYLQRLEVAAGVLPDGAIIDEISNVGPTKITALQDGEIRTSTTTPGDWGVRQAQPKEILCVDPWMSAVKIMAILRGACNDAHKDLLLINASQFLYLTGKAQSRKEGTEMARAAVDDGRALEKLRAWVEASGGEPSAFEMIVAASSREDRVERIRHPLKAKVKHRMSRQ
jgi:anthranilate phosphoribosyltransferase